MYYGYYITTLDILAYTSSPPVTLSSQTLSFYNTKAASPNKPAATTGTFRASAAPVNSGNVELTDGVDTPLPVGNGDGNDTGDPVG
jgi:hypothetical protein